MGSLLNKYVPLDQQTPGCWRGGKMEREGGKGRGKEKERKAGGRGSEHHILIRITTGPMAL